MSKRRKKFTFSEILLLFCFLLIIRTFTSCSGYEDQTIKQVEKATMTFSPVVVTHAPLPSETPTPTTTPEPTAEPAIDYVLNINTHKFHYPYCKSVNEMKEKNKQHFSGSRDEVLRMGFDSCKNCDP